MTWSWIAPNLLRDDNRQEYNRRVAGREHILARSGVAACVLATVEIVEIHIVLSALFDRPYGVEAEATADGVGDDPKPLSKLVDEAEGESPVANVRPDEEHPGNYRGLVLGCQQGRTAKAAFRRLGHALAHVEQMAGSGGDAPVKPGA